MKTEKHTPTPLTRIVYDRNLHQNWFEFKGRLAVDVREDEKPMWEEIVRAVNLFHALVENIKDAHKFLAEGSLLKNEISEFLEENNL
jgi:hypothetical protein